MSSEALDQFCMANTRSLPWIWVIEALASSKSLDTSLLIHLVKNIPDISGEMGKDAREAVSLRILEGLAARDNQDNDSISDTGERIEFDPSESCENVLRQILEEVPASNVKSGGLKMLKWDVKSFIARKRPCLPSFSLQKMKDLKSEIANLNLHTVAGKKLKDAILEGSHSVLESIKERSGIAFRTQCHDNILVDGGNFDEPGQRLEGSGKNVEAVASSANAKLSCTEVCDNELQEDVHDRTLLPAKRNRSEVTAESLERQTYTGTNTTPLREAAKKYKQDENVSSHDDVDVLITSCQHDIPVKPSEILEENVETEGCPLDKEVEVGDGERLASPDSMEDQEATLERLAIPVNKDNATNLSSQMQRQNEKIGEGVREGFQLKTSNAPSLAAIEASNCENKAMNCFKHDYHGSSAAEAKDDIEHDQDTETTSDSDEYHEETSDMNSKKDAFVSSQCTHTQDSLSTQLNHCMKCNIGGQLLTCSSNTCPIVVHESCLGSAANFDGEGRFCCPFCAYSRAIAAYLEVKKRASLARKDLAIFIGLKVGRRPKLSERSHKSKRDLLKRDDNLSKSSVPDNHNAVLSGINQNNSSSNLEDGQKMMPSDPCAGNGSSCREKLVDVTHEAPCISEKIDLDGKKMGQECQSPSKQGTLQVDAPPLKISGGDVSSDKEKGSSDKNVRHNRIREHKKMRSESASHAGAPCCSNIESSEEESDKSAVSNYTIRLRKTPRHYTYLAIPQLRRKKLPWTSVEEEKLKEGVQRFCDASDRMIPWKQILEFGADAFQKGRTTIDLKDKWRNLCKGSPKKK